MRHPSEFPTYAELSAENERLRKAKAAALKIADERTGADLAEVASLRTQLATAKGIIKAIFDPSGADDELRKAVEAFLAASA